MAGDTDVLVTVNCPECGHQQMAWYSHIVDRLIHCNECDTELKPGNVQIG